MSKIAYDLDGVLVPDCDKIPHLGDLGDYLEMATHMLPLFQPGGKYWIITARPKKYKKITKKWIKNHFANPPHKLHHDCEDESPAEYKARILNANPRIQTYVESDINIVRDLIGKVHTGCKIIHYSTFISSIMAGI